MNDEAPRAPVCAAAPPRDRLRLRLFRLGRTTVEMPALLVPLLAVLAYVLSARVLGSDGSLAGTGGATLAALGILGTLGVVASALVHDLAHAAVLAAFGHAPDRVVLFSHAEGLRGDREAATPGEDLVVALAGPIATLAVAAAAATAGWGLAAPPAFAALARFLAVANLLLALSALLPGLPLDGGRALRAIGWGITGSRLSGCRFARTAAAASAVACLLVGVAASLASRSLGPLAWATLLALALWLQSRVAWRATRLRFGLEGLVVRDVLEPAPPALSRVVSVGETLETFGDAGRPGSPLRLDRRSAFLVDHDGRLGGLVTLAALLAVPDDERLDTPVGQVTTRLRQDLVLAPALALESAVRRLRATGLPFLPVIEDRQVLGVLSRAGIERLLVARGLG